jgi:hypothetical protein
MQTVSVISSQCVRDRVFGDRLRDATFRNVESANDFARELLEPGVSVIVRPNYNEHDHNGRFFREWRSFNGEPFREVRWQINF